MDQENKKQIACLGLLLLGPSTGLISLMIGMYQGLNPVTAMQKTLKLLAFFTLLGIFIPAFIPGRK